MCEVMVDSSTIAKVDGLKRQRRSIAEKRKIVEQAMLRSASDRVLGFRVCRPSESWETSADAEPCFRQVISQGDRTVGADTLGEH